MLPSFRQTEITGHFWRGGCALGTLGNAEGGSIDGRQSLLVIGRGAAHSNTQKEKNESIGSLLGYRENTEERGTKETKRRNLGLLGVAPSLL